MSSLHRFTPDHSVNSSFQSQQHSLQDPHAQYRPHTAPGATATFHGYPNPQQEPAQQQSTESASRVKTRKAKPKSASSSSAGVKTTSGSAVHRPSVGKKAATHSKTAGVPAPPASTVPVYGNYVPGPFTAYQPQISAQNVSTASTGSATRSAMHSLPFPVPLDETFIENKYRRTRTGNSGPSRVSSSNSSGAKSAPKSAKKSLSSSLSSTGGGLGPAIVNTSLLGEGSVSSGGYYYPPSVAVQQQQQQQQQPYVAYPPPPPAVMHPSSAHDSSPIGIRQPIVTQPRSMTKSPTASPSRQQKQAYAYTQPANSSSGSSSRSNRASTASPHRVSPARRSVTSVSSSYDSHTNNSLHNNINNFSYLATSTTSPAVGRPPRHPTTGMGSARRAVSAPPRR
jgi:hypothetical protein